METKHLKYFKVENFKCFDSFEMDDIGQFNLIVGDNNVGKTSVLEALLFREDLSQTIGNFILSIASRNQTTEITDYFNFEKYIFNFREKKTELNFNFRYNNEPEKIKLKILWKENKDLIEEEIKLLKKDPFVVLSDVATKKSFVQYKNNSLQDISPEGVKSKLFSGYYPFISSTKIYDRDLVTFFSNLFIDKNYSKLIVDDLKLFVRDIEGIDTNPAYIPGENVLMISLKDVQQKVLLSSLGEGAIKYFRIILEMSEETVKGNRLMIDEIDNGVHYSKLKAYWIAIIKAAKNNKVQLFATTHSLECLKYFKEALEDLEKEYPNDGYQSKAKNFLLSNDKHGKIFSYNYSFDQFQYLIDNQIEIRGGN